MTKVRKNSTLVSMTGFGKGSARSKSVVVEVELKSYNHRFLDFTFKMPKAYAQFEFDIKSAISERLERGRIEVMVSRLSAETPLEAINFDRGLFDAYLSIYTKVRRQLKLDSSDSQVLLDILNRKEVLGIKEEISGAAEQKLLMMAVQAACDALVQMRAREGQRLAQDITGRLASLDKLRGQIFDLTSKLVGQQKTRLITRIKALAPEIVLDESRLVSEVALIADRVDVTEELVRLESHLRECNSTISNAVAGRRLDFLFQELGREFNTIGSKAQDAKVQATVVDAKVELEKLREQVQNIV